MVNLWSPRIEYIDYGKSHIDLKPFSKTIIETLYKMCSGGSSVVGEGNTDSCEDYGGSDKQNFSKKATYSSVKQSYTKEYR